MNSLILFVNRWFGIFPYKFIPPQMEFCPLSAFIGITLSVFAVYNLQLLLNNPDNYHPDALTNIVRCLFDIVTNAHSCFTWTIRIFFGKSYLRAWFLRSKIDKLNQNSSNSNSFRWIVLILFSFIGCFLLDFFSYKYDFCYWFTVYLPFLVDLCITWNYGFWMEYLVRQLMFLNRRLKCLVSVGLASSDRMEQLHNLSRVYFNLFDLSVELNNVFGSHVIYFFVCYGMSFALNMYYLSIGGYSNDENLFPFYGSIFWTLVRFFQLLSISVYCDCVTAQFAKTQQRTSQVWKMVPAFDRRFAAQVFSFATMINFCPIVSSVGETFHVDYSSLFSMIISVVTNSVIFAQAAKLEKN